MIVGGQMTLENFIREIKNEVRRSRETSEEDDRGSAF